MEVHYIKASCLELLSKRKGYSVEVDDYEDDLNEVRFEIRLLKNNAYRASLRCTISKGTGLSEKSQLESKLGRFTADVEYGRV
jgi:hypothetical protein